MYGPPECPGIVPRIVEDLFASITESKTSNGVTTVHLSYFEIYNEKLFDLLQDRKVTPKVCEKSFSLVFVTAPILIVRKFPVLVERSRTPDEGPIRGGSHTAGGALPGGSTRLAKTGRFTTQCRCHRGERP